MNTLDISGQLRLLGTPAGQGGGGKTKLIETGAFDPQEDIAAATMAHPVSQNEIPRSSSGLECKGVAGFRSSASQKFRAESRGTRAYAATEP
ncbi:hypothetical protein QQS21_007569 [Conoideocrella luteorostrata]|uniref:Uncharacterized protein n=1 Tax=Conoideocrella luteorostrata TaxID=1105319 RepID=A0AAJ0FWV9_9HYPO|nr:hypothetical protein QQS21_007569 [Conoideocrella luteorostrata]